nr:acyltransferase [Modestobacter versicolor]
MVDRKGAAPLATPGSGPDRLVALDGLRGIAALVVVVHHALLTWQVLAAQYFVDNRGSGSWWLTFTPLHLIWAGTEAVMVFFVLSGLVLALPFLERAPHPGGWRGYYGQRLVRLYVPVVASVLLAAAFVRTFPREHGATTSWWFDAHAVPADAATLARDAVLVSGVSWVNPSLWSLQYEVLFSVLLPLHVLAARRLGERAGWLVPPLLVLAGAGVLVGEPVLAWLPVFGLGVVMAVLRRRLQRLGSGISSGPAARAVWLALTAAAVVLLLAEWWSRGLHQVAPLPLAVARTCGVAGAVLVVFLAMACPAAGALLTLRPVRWLGAVSFSLYLVHEPVLVSVSSLVGGSRRGVAVTLVVGIGLALVLATVFHRLVEVPSQRLARAVAVRLRGSVAPAADAPPLKPFLPPVPRHAQGRLPVRAGSVLPRGPAVLPLPTMPIRVQRPAPPRTRPPVPAGSGGPRAHPVPG